MTNKKNGRGRPRPFSFSQTFMKLQQGQIWQKGDEYFRIVEWARLMIEYKLMKDLETKEGTLHQVSKKEFCRLIKGAVLLDPNVKCSGSDGGEDKRGAGGGVDAELVVDIDGVDRRGIDPGVPAEDGSIGIED